MSDLPGGETPVIYDAGQVVIPQSGVIRGRVFSPEQAVVEASFTPSLFQSHAEFSSTPTAKDGVGHKDEQPDALPGTGVIAGVTTVLGDPSAQRVRLYSRPTGELLAETFADEDGVYEFRGLDPGVSYYVVGLHGLAQYNAVVADNIVPEDT